MALLDLKAVSLQTLVAPICSPVLVGLEAPGGSLFYSSLSQTLELFWKLSLRPVAVIVAGTLSTMIGFGKRIEVNRDDFLRPTDITNSAPTTRR